MKTVNTPKTTTKQVAEVNYTLPTIEEKASAKFFKRSFSWDSDLFEVLVEIQAKEPYSSSYTYKQEVIEYCTNSDGKVKDAFKIERKTVYGSSLADKESTGEHDWKPTTREEFEAVRQQALICFNKPLSIKKTIEVEVSY